MLFFDFEHLVLSVQLAFLDAQLNQVIAICVVFLELYVEVVVEIKEFLLKFELLIKDILALGFFVTALVNKICASMLESIYILFVFDTNLAFFILLLQLYLVIGDVLPRYLVLEFHIVLVDNSLIFEQVIDGIIQNFLCCLQLRDSVFCQSDIILNLIVILIEVHSSFFLSL